MAINNKVIILLAFFVLSVTGCAEINLFEAPTQVLKHPLGTDPIKIGMSKDEVVSMWGRPDQINNLEPTDEWRTSREEWVYIGRYSKIPVDKNYLSKTKYLIFDGKHLACIGDESQCVGPRAEKSKTE